MDATAHRLYRVSDGRFLTKVQALGVFNNVDPGLMPWVENAGPGHMIGLEGSARETYIVVTTDERCFRWSTLANSGSRDKDFRGEVRL